MRFIKKNFVISILFLVMLIPITFVIIVAVVGANAESDNYTYRYTSTDIGLNWNPHEWSLGSENTNILTYTASALFDKYEILDNSEIGRDKINYEIENGRLKESEVTQWGLVRNNNTEKGNPIYVAPDIDPDSGDPAVDPETGDTIFHIVSSTDSSGLVWNELQPESAYDYPYLNDGVKDTGKSVGLEIALRTLDKDKQNGKAENPSLNYGDSTYGLSLRVKYEQAKDENGNLLYEKDEDGNFILDDNGEKIPVVAKDESGNKIPQKNPDGSLVYDTDENGNFQLLESDERRAYKVPVRNDMYWQDGTPITMDDYLWSLQALLSPIRKTYRSELYRTGSMSIVGADGYYSQKAAIGAFDETDNDAWKNDVGIEIWDRLEGDDQGIMGYLMFVYDLQAPSNIQDMVVRYDSDFLVQRALYEELQVNVGGLWITSYNTSAKNSMSHGPYKMIERTDSTMVFEKNKFFFDETGDTTAAKRFKGHFQPTRVRVDLDSSGGSVSRLQFLNGELDYVALGSGDTDLRGSKRRRDELASFSMRIYFNIDREALNKIQDPSNGKPSSVFKPTNLQYLANENFRQAFSLAMDRSQLAQAYGPASVPSTVMWNDTYLNSVAAPGEQYRYSDDALRVILERDGVDTNPDGEPMTNAQMRAEYAKVTGFDGDKAKELFAQARKEELAEKGETDNGQLEVVNFTLYTGSMAQLTGQQPTMNQLQKNLDAAMPAGLKVTFTMRVQPAGSINRYTMADNGDVEAIFGANGGATTNITDPLRYFTGLSSSATSGGADNGGTYGLHPEEMLVTIPMKKFGVLSGDPALYGDDEQKTVLDIWNNIDPKNDNTTYHKDETTGDLTLFLNQWGVLFGSTAKKAENDPKKNPDLPTDNIDYTFMPGGKPGSLEENQKLPAIGSFASVQFLRHVLPYLEDAILGEYAQIPLAMDNVAYLASFRTETLVERADPVLTRTGNFRFLRLTMTDGEWNKEVSANRAGLRDLYFL